MDSFLIVFFVLFISRYLRLIVNTIAYFTIRAVPVPLKPSLHTENVTVIISTTTGEGPEFLRCLASILACSPAQVIVVTAVSRIERVKEFCKLNGFVDVRVIGVRKLNKRSQMVMALRQVRTPITIFSDDDVIWPPNYLNYLLAAFEDPTVGGAGSRQRAWRNPRPNLWNFLGICYLERRNFNIGATNYLDGAVSTLSGRTSAYRTNIIQNEAFYEAFLNDTWLGRKLNTDDDKCLTRWVFSNGWKIKLQFSEHAVLSTTLEDNTKFLSQCVRWARAHWRGNLTVMMNNNYWYRTHPWSFYAVYLASFQTPALLVDGVLFYILLRGVASLSETVRSRVVTVFAVWLLSTKVIKLIPHLLRHPEDVVFLPASIAFGYLHGFINIYALLTLHVTAWGSRNLEEQPVEKTIELAA